MALRQLNNADVASDGSEVEGALVSQAEGIGGEVGLVEAVLHLLQLAGQCC